MSRQLTIPEFFSGKCVFVTGGTGFIGKMIVEKLLRSCPDVDTIYLLARQKKNKTAADRVQEITDSPLFDVLRSKNPAAFNKISLIEGDTSREFLGMSEVDQELFCDRINVIIHSAATISFKEPLKVAIATNLQSVYELIKLARKVKKLDSFVHMSTAYTNWFRSDVGEIFYKPDYDPEEVLEWCKTLTDEELNKKIPSLKPHENTYTFSKALAEYLVSKETKNLPLTVVRPSIVSSSFKEPFAGWIDNWGGTGLFVYMTAKGIIRNLQMKDFSVCDLIPADTTVNMTLAAAWKVGTEKNVENSQPTIYNCTTSSINPLLFEYLFTRVIHNARNFPHNDVSWYPNFTLRNSKLTQDLSVFAYQRIPAYISDLGLRLIGKKPRMIKLQDMIYSNFEDVKFATISRILFRSENPSKLASAMSQKDLQEFDFDVRKINWNKHLENYHLGLRKHMGRDKSENFEELRRKVTRLKYTKYLVTGSLIVGSLFLLNATKNLITKNQNNVTRDESKL